MSARILLIDDDPLYHKMIQKALEQGDYVFEVALNGREGLEKVRAFQPDLIITDVMMPEMDGYAFTSSLRRLPEFAKIPVLTLSAQAEIQDKIKSFEAGADDYLTKPFQPMELKARVEMLLRRAELFKKAMAQQAPAEERRQAHLIAVHSLRGGVGNSTLAVNLALALQELWNKRTLLLDLALLAGQVSLLLNEPIRRSWGDIARFTPETIDEVALQSVISVYENGLYFIAAPTMPAEAEKISPELYIRVLDMLREQYDYIIADLAHDFSEISLHTLDRADLIIVPIAPELASARAATLTLDTYRQLGYPEEKSLVVLNMLSSANGISREKLESALGKRIPLTLPYEPDVFWQALNFGRPLVLHAPTSRSAPLLEDFAFYVSAPDDKKKRPGKPTAVWERVFQRYLRRRQKR